MAAIERKSLDSPEDTRTFDKGRLDLVTIGGMTIGRAMFEPGWRWEDSIKPISGTDSCQLSHVGYVVSGRLRIVMDDGEEVEYVAGDAMSVEPGHLSWVEGDETTVVLDFSGNANLYAMLEFSGTAEL